MTRATSAVARHRKRKRLFKQAKGFWGDRKNHTRLTKDAVMQAQKNNYKHRKLKKRDFRALWITRISAAAKINGISYSKLIQGLKKMACELDRKLLADIAVRDPAAFSNVVGQAKQALA
jgi:large subunit ribosomal protein L20